MAIESVAVTPASSAENQSVIIRGCVLRKMRREIGLRLIDLAGGKGQVARISRLERRPAHRLTAAFLNSLLPILRIGPTFTELDKWHNAIMADVIKGYTRGDVCAVRRTVTALELIVAPCPPETHLLAQIFAARSAEIRPPSSITVIMRGFSIRAERETAWPAAAWAYLFESEAQEAAGNHEAALAAATGAIGIPHTEGTALPLLCLGAAAARGFARCGRPTDGLVILESAPIRVSQPFAVAQLSRAAALIHQVSGARARAEACLERAAEAAEAIPNPTLGAEIRQELAQLYARDGQADLASIQQLRAAALCRRAGHAVAALALIDAALGPADAKR